MAAYSISETHLADWAVPRRSPRLSDWILFLCIVLFSDLVWLPVPFSLNHNLTISHAHLYRGSLARALGRLNQAPC
jgi:hypothetical protein